MKKGKLAMARPTSTWATILGTALLVAASAYGQSENVYTGEIADSQCAFNVHSLSASHKEMIDMGSAGKTSTDCAHFCVKQRGGKYVLQTKHEVYKLDRQDLAEQSAGLKVKLVGTLDPKTNIVQVRSIEPLRAK
jgi:hypothetical protein